MIITIVPAPEPPSRTAPKVCSVSPVVVVLSVTAVVIVVSAAVDVAYLDLLYDWCLNIHNNFS